MLSGYGSISIFSWWSILYVFISWPGYSCLEIGCSDSSSCCA
jgi:hypothetical protein